MTNRILIVDDDKDLCALIQKCIRQDGFEAASVHTGAEGLQKLRESRYAFDLVILDIMFQLMDLLSALCGEGRAVAVVLHDLALALEYADDVLLMRDGRIEGTGAPDDLCASGAIQDAFGVEIERTSAGRYALAPARGRGDLPRA